MEYSIEQINEKKLVGKGITTTFADDKTAELWRSFMPHRKEIENKVNSNLYSLQIYPPGFFQNFNPNTPFTKWAAVEVEALNNYATHFNTFILEGGLYAVFKHIGAATNMATFDYIFKVWLPNSKNYVLDQRPHFEVLGEKYKNNDPLSEEEIWIPIKALQ